MEKTFSFKTINIKGLWWTIFCPSFTKALWFLCSLSIGVDKHLKLPSFFLPNGFGLGIFFYVYYSGNFGDFSESHNPILLISEKSFILTDEWVEIWSYYHLKICYKIDNLQSIWTMYTWLDKGWSQPKLVPSNPPCWSPGPTALHEYLCTQSKGDVCNLRVHFSACVASRLESQQYKPARSHLGQEVKDYI